MNVLVVCVSLGKQSKTNSCLRAHSGHKTDSQETDKRTLSGPVMGARNGVRRRGGGREQRYREQ